MPCAVLGVGAAGGAAADDDEGRDELLPWTGFVAVVTVASVVRVVALDCPVRVPCMLEL